MFVDSERRRVLIAAGPGADRTLRELFSRDPLDRWDTLEADSFSRARFVLQHDPCDLLLVSDDLYEREGGQGLAWIVWQRETPVVFLGEASAVRFQKAYELGASACLVRPMALEHPPLLAAALDQASKIGELRQSCRKTKERLTESRQHVDRLVNMIWRTGARRAETQWFSQRYMLERLSEELARVERHQVPLTLAIGELQAAPGADVEQGPVLPDWTMDLIIRGKRRCDVAGQYGLGGFMILMVHTPLQGGINCCRRLQKTLEHPQEPLPGPHVGWHAYFGVSGTSTGKMSAAAMLRAAEQNLDAARADERERIVVFDA
jgi:PleD family two-component response regulator